MKDVVPLIIMYGYDEKSINLITEVLGEKKIDAYFEGSVVYNISVQRNKLPEAISVIRKCERLRGSGFELVLADGTREKL